MPLGKHLNLPLHFESIGNPRLAFWNLPGPEPLLIMKCAEKFMVLDGEGRVARGEAGNIYTTYGPGIYPISDGVFITLRSSSQSLPQDTILALRRRNGAWSEERFLTASLGVVDQVFEADGRPAILRYQRSRINGPAFSYVDTTGTATAVSAMLRLPLPDSAQAEWFLPRPGGYHLIWYAKPSPIKPDSLYLSALDSDFQVVGAPHLLAAGSRCPTAACLSPGVYFQKAERVSGHLEIFWIEAGNLYRTALNMDLSPRQVRQQLSRFHAHPEEQVFLSGTYQAGVGLREIHWYGNHSDCRTHQTRIVLDAETGRIVREEETQRNTQCGVSSGTSPIDQPVPFGNGYSLVYREESGARPTIRRERTGDWVPVGLGPMESPARKPTPRYRRILGPVFDMLGRKSIRRAPR
jgi:hypothetical protein